MQTPNLDSPPFQRSSPLPHLINIPLHIYPGPYQMYERERSIKFQILTSLVFDHGFFCPIIAVFGKTLALDRVSAFLPLH